MIPCCWRDGDPVRACPWAGEGIKVRACCREARNAGSALPRPEERPSSHIPACRHARVMRRGVAGCRTGESRQRAVLQGQADHAPDQLWRRRPRRHRGPAVRTSSRPTYRWQPDHHRAEHGRRRRIRGRELHRRGRAEGRHHGGPSHRRGVALCQQSGTLPRRPQELRVHRLSAEHDGELCAHRCRARPPSADRHRQGEGRRVRRPSARTAARTCSFGSASISSVSPTSTSRPIATARRRGWRCSRARSISIPNRRRATAPSSTPAS